jgi:transcriptional regulator with XRE-family HTH domain
MPTIEQIRSARAYLGWSQKDLADHAGISQTGLARIENGTNKPNSQTLSKITRAFEDNYIEFISNGIRKASDIIQIRQGPNSYIELLDEALESLTPQKDEILFWGADEKRSSDFVIEKTKQLRNNGISMRFLIQENDNYFMGEPEEYRWLNKELYIDSDVKVIFGGSVSFFVSWRNISRVISIKDNNIYKEHKKLFDYFWNHSNGPKTSSSGVRYE